MTSIRLLGVYFRSFYLIRFIIVSVVFNVVFFLYYSDSTVENSTGEVFKYIYNGRFFELDVLGGLIWTAHFVINVFFIGSFIENNFYSQSASILLRTSRILWYFSYSLFLFIVSFLYLLIQILSYIIYFSLISQSLYLISIDKIIMQGICVIISMFAILSLFFLCYLLFKLKVSFIIVTIILFIYAFVVREDYIYLLPGGIGMLNSLNFNGMSKILVVQIIYCSTFICFGLFKIHKMDILKNIE
jgi:hypothetical protein